MKKAIELTMNRFRTVSGPTKHRSYVKVTGRSNVTSEVGYWGSRCETSEIAENRQEPSLGYEHSYAHAQHV